MKASMLFERLRKLSKATASASEMGPVGSYWVGDRAGERQALDNLTAGRIFWAKAHNSAKSGLNYLKSGEVEMAEIALFNGLQFYGAALERMITKEQFRNLTSPAYRRGRQRTNSLRDEQLWNLVKPHLDSGLSYKAARAAALTKAKNSNPILFDEIEGLGDAAIRKALGPFLKENS